MTIRADKRARLTVKRGLRPNTLTGRRGSRGGLGSPFFGPGSPLAVTGGIIFPYTPNITYGQAVEYSSYETVHSNYQQNAFSKSRNPQIQVVGQFISQTPEEAEYTVGVMHFLRVVTKMNFGQFDPQRGTPPPVLEFSAYGTYNFERVPVLVQGFNWIYEDDVDYVEVDSANGGAVQIPTVVNIAIDLLPQYSPAKQNNFDLNSFANGGLYREGFL